MKLGSKLSSKSIFYGKYEAKRFKYNEIAMPDNNLGPQFRSSIAGKIVNRSWLSVCQVVQAGFRIMETAENVSEGGVGKKPIDGLPPYQLGMDEIGDKDRRVIVDGINELYRRVTPDRFDGRKVIRHKLKKRYGEREA